jgi:hypothetical protein
MKLQCEMRYIPQWGHIDPTDWRHHLNVEIDDSELNKFNHPYYLIAKIVKAESEYVYSCESPSQSKPQYRWTEIK